MENENNSVELVEEQKTEKEDVDFPYEAKKIFGLLDKEDEKEDDE